MTRVLFLGRRDRVYARLAALSGLQAGQQALDVGSGSGALTRALARLAGPGGSVTGVDPGVEMVAWCREQPAAPGAAPIRYAAGPAQALELPDASVEVVASALVIHHIEAAQRPAAVAEMARVVRPGGLVLLVDIDPARSRVGKKLLDALLGPQMARRDPQELADLLAGAGLVVQERGRRGLLGYARALRPSHTEPGSGASRR